MESKTDQLFDEVEVMYKKMIHENALDKLSEFRMDNPNASIKVYQLTKMWVWSQANNAVSAFVR